MIERRVAAEVTALLDRGCTLGHGYYFLRPTPSYYAIRKACAPLVVAGAILGVRLVKFVPQKAFNLIVQVLAAAGAIDLIAHKWLFG